MISFLFSLTVSYDVNSSTTCRLSNCVLDFEDLNDSQGNLSQVSIFFSDANVDIKNLPTNLTLGLVGDSLLVINRKTNTGFKIIPNLNIQFKLNLTKPSYINIYGKLLSNALTTISLTIKCYDEATVVFSPTTWVRNMFFIINFYSNLKIISKCQEPPVSINRYNNSNLLLQSEVLNLNIHRGIRVIGDLIVSCTLPQSKVLISDVTFRDNSVKFVSTAKTFLIRRFHLEDVIVNAKKVKLQVLDFLRISDSSKLIVQSIDATNIAFVYDSTNLPRIVSDSITYKNIYVKVLSSVANIRTDIFQSKEKVDFSVPTLSVYDKSNTYLHFEVFNNDATYGLIIYNQITDFYRKIYLTEGECSQQSNMRCSSLLHLNNVLENVRTAMSPLTIFIADKYEEIVNFTINDKVADSINITFLNKNYKPKVNLTISCEITSLLMNGIEIVALKNNKLIKNIYGTNCSFRNGISLNSSYISLIDPEIEGDLYLNSSHAIKLKYYDTKNLTLFLNDENLILYQNNLKSTINLSDHNYEEVDIYCDDYSVVANRTDMNSILLGGNFSFSSLKDYNILNCVEPSVATFSPNEVVRNLNLYGTAKFYSKNSVSDQSNITFRSQNAHIEFYENDSKPVGPNELFLENPSNYDSDYVEIQPKILNLSSNTASRTVLPYMSSIKARYLRIHDPSFVLGHVFEGVEEIDVDYSIFAIGYLSCSRIVPFDEKKKIRFNFVNENQNDQFFYDDDWSLFEISVVCFKDPNYKLNISNFEFKFKSIHWNFEGNRSIFEASARDNCIVLKHSENGGKIPDNPKQKKKYMVYVIVGVSLFVVLVISATIMYFVWRKARKNRIESFISDTLSSTLI